MGAETQVPLTNPGTRVVCDGPGFGATRRQRRHSASPVNAHGSIAQCGAAGLAAMIRQGGG